MSGKKSIGLKAWVNTLFNSQFKLVMWWGWLIIVSKIVRYTVLYETLVKASIGWGYLSVLNSHQASLGGITLSSDDAVNPSDNALFLLQILSYLGVESYYGYEILLTIIGNSLLFYIIKKCKSRYLWIESLFIVIGIMTINVFALNLAKDVIQFLLFVALFMLLKDIRKTDLKIVGVLALVITISALSFRLYYMLLVYFFLIVYVVDKIMCNVSNQWIRIIAMWMVVGFSYLAVLYVVQQILPGYHDEMLRVRSRESDAVTDIQLLFNSQQLWLWGLDYMIMILRLLFPVELIMFGPKFIAFLGVQLTYTFTFLYAFWHKITADGCEKIGVLIYFAFVGMSATFEPDFGSWIRHECIIFPVLLIALGLNRQKMEREYCKGNQ